MTTPKFDTGAPVKTGVGYVNDNNAGTPANETTVPNTATSLSATQKDAFAQVKAQLDEYGLGSLSTFVYNEIVLGKSADEIARDLRETPEYKTRFPAIAAREAKGLPALSPAEYVQYEKSATELMRAAGLPKGFYDSTDDFTKLLSGDVSVAELNDRIDAAKNATFNIPAAAQARLWSEYGLAPGSGQLASFFLDPDKALPLIQRDLQAAQIGGRADMAGFAGVSNDKTHQLAQAGVSDSQAQQGFEQLAHSRELFQTLPGESDLNITVDDQLGATFLGDAKQADRIEAQRRKRQAEFEGGVGYATGQGGVTGLGRADT